MSENVDKQELIADAVSRFGKTLNIDLEDDDPRGNRLNTIYEGTLRLAFGYHAWSWMKDLRKCDKVDKQANGVDPDDPWPNGHNYCHQLPGDLYGNVTKILPGNSCGSAVRNFDRLGSRIFSEFEEIWIEGRFAKSPEVWPGPWREGFTVLLAGRCALPESHDPDLKEEFLTEALGPPSERRLPGGMFGRLIAQDLAENPPDSPFRHGDPLTNARRGYPRGISTPWNGRY